MRKLLFKMFFFSLDVTRFRECCGRAYSSAVKLASFAAGVTEASLRQYYEDSVQSGWFDSGVGHVMDFENDSDDEEEAAEARDLPLGIDTLVLNIFDVLVFEQTSLKWINNDKHGFMIGS